VSWPLAIYSDIPVISSNVLAELTPDTAPGPTQSSPKLLANLTNLYRIGDPFGVP
jgi:hypothetical protein